MRSVREKVRKAVFSKLRSLRRKLNGHGVPCIYARSVLSHQDGASGFKITYETTGNNGNTTLLPKLSIRIGTMIEEFDHTNFEQGLVRLKHQFYAHESRDGVDS